MGLSAAGADRFLRALTGQAVSAGSSMAGKLHIASPPTTSNELSGNGYSDHDLTTGNFTRSNQNSGADRRLAFPTPMTFFTDAGVNAQTAASFGFWHGTTLIWDGDVNITPNRASVTVTDTFLQVPYTTSGFTLTQEGVDRGLRAISGQNYAAADMFWELHSGGTNVVPSSANRLTGGGIDGIADVAWGFSTSGGNRRVTQTALLEFASALTGDTNAEPTKLALWRGRPESSGVLHAYRTVAPSHNTEMGSSIRIAANALYIQINLAGTAV